MELGENVVKNVCYSPDGSCLAVTASDSPFRLTTSQGVPVSSYVTGGDIFDFDFYPGFSSSEPQTQAVLIASRNRPMQLVSTTNMSPLSAYTAYSFTDEVVHPICVRFSPTCQKIFGAFPQSTLRVWDVQRPGRQTDTITFSTKREKDESVQKGILSAIDVASEDHIFVGSYSRSIFGYDLRDWKSSRTKFGCEKQTHVGGLVQLKYIESRSLLLSGHRMDRFVYGWDVRKPNEPVVHLGRKTGTNQRFTFDIVDDRMLFCGDSEGHLLTFDLDHSSLVQEVNISDRANSVVSVSVKGGLVACGVGTRTFAHVGSDDEEITEEGSRVVVFPLKKEALTL